MQAQQKAPERPKVTAESQLLQAVERLNRHRDGRLALHVHLSRLQAEHRRDHHIRVAARTLESALKQADGQIFVLHNRDIVFMGKNVKETVAEDAIIRLRYLFSEDPLIQFNDDSESLDFATWYRFENDYEQLLETVRKMASIVDVSKGDAKAQQRPRVPLNLANLAKLQQTLSSANVSALVRNQAVCAILPGQPPVPVFDEVFVSVDHIQKNLLPDVDLRASRWLFLELTETLDKRVLSYLRQEAQFRDKPFSMNMNLATILTPEFLKFDEDLAGRLRGRLVIELHITDVLADVGSFFFVRDFLKDRGHRICLDGLTQYTMPLVRDTNWEFDLIKVFWNQRLVSPGGEKERETFRASLKRQDQSRIVLARCDNESAIEFGQQLGVDLFQGFAVDNALRNAQPHINMNRK